MMAMHPEIQEKVYEEIRAVVTDPTNVKYEELGDLKYTERVIKETMRLFPTVPAIARVASAPFQLSKSLPSLEYLVEFSNRTIISHLSPQDNSQFPPTHTLSLVS